jgi:predicted nucleic acid-binding protein
LVVLDAGAIIALGRGDADTRAAVEQAARHNYTVVVPTPVVTQVHRGGYSRASIDRVFKSIGMFLPTTVRTARRAGELLGRARMSDAVDAIVAAEALGGTPSLVLTSDPDDLDRLIEDEPEAGRVLVVRI